MRDLMLFAGVVLGFACASLLAQDVAKPQTGEEKLIAGFEDAEPPKDWYAQDGKLSLSPDHATEGKQALKVELTAGAYPGFGVELRAQDWSPYDALRFSLTSEGRESQLVTIRVDETASRGYGTRCNFEDKTVAVSLHFGLNEIEIPIASMKQGTPESQGINVARVKLLRVFAGGLKKPVTWHLDNVRLVRAERKGPDTLVIADFDKVEGAVKPAGGTNVEPVDAPEGQGGKALKVTLTPDAQYPGVYVAVPQDWLSYDALVFSVYCPEGSATPTGMALKVNAGDGRSMTFSTELQKGMNEIYLPLELASFVSLSRVRELNLFWGRRAAAETVVLDNFRLVREKLVDAPTRHAPAAEGDRFAIDFTGLQVGKNTCMMVTAWVPLKDGGYRVVRANSPDKAQLSYGFDAEALAGMADKKPVRVWVMFLDHGVWHWCETHVPLKADGQTKFTLDDRARFGI